MNPPESGNAAYSQEFAQIRARAEASIEREVAYSAERELARDVLWLLDNIEGRVQKVEQRFAWELRGEL